MAHTFAGFCVTGTFAACALQQQPTRAESPCHGRKGRPRGASDPEAKLKEKEKEYTELFANPYKDIALKLAETVAK